MDLLTYECGKQTQQYNRLVTEGFQIVDDPGNLADRIGRVTSVECYCEMWTPRLLCKLYVTGTESSEQSFHLVPLHQIVRWAYQVPHPGDTFTADFVIGTRKVGDQQMVPALRLPLR
jgi:hypothetical protein